MKYIEEYKRKRILETSLLVVNSIAFRFIASPFAEVDDDESNVLLEVLDLRYRKYCAYFAVKYRDFELQISTFSQSSKRKYEMLYYLEQNKCLLLSDFKLIEY